MGTKKRFTIFQCAVIHVRRSMHLLKLHKKQRIMK